MDIASRASRLFDEIVMAVYDKPAKSLMFSPEERIGLVREAFQDNPKISVTGYSGLTVEFARKIGAQVIVRGLRVFSDFEFEFRMALANHRLADDIEIVALITAEEHTFLSSTTVREIAMLNGDISSMVPPFVERAFKEKVALLDDSNPIPNSLRD
jgi:pantetheine-phosphate adenylyltransferase